MLGNTRVRDEFYVSGDAFFGKRARVAKASRTTLRRENSGSSYTPDAHDRNIFALNLNQSTVAINNPINLPGQDETMVLTFMLKPRSSVTPSITWGSRYLFPSGSVPVNTTSGNRTDVVHCLYDGSFYLLCAAALNYDTT
jgi:hypothetical protein